jgi:hypothetical protein
MHVHINVKSSNNISEWQMGFNSAFKGLISTFTGYKQYSISDTKRAVILEKKISAATIRLNIANV